MPAFAGLTEPGHDKGLGEGLTGLHQVLARALGREPYGARKSLRFRQAGDWRQASAAPIRRASVPENSCHTSSQRTASRRRPGSLHLVHRASRPRRSDAVHLAPTLRYQPSLAAQMAWPQTASFAAFTGRTLSILRAGFALNTVGSLVNGLMPWRSLVAGFLTTMNLAKPGSRNSPDFFISW